MMPAEHAAWWPVEHAGAALAALAHAGKRGQSPGPTALADASPFLGAPAPWVARDRAALGRWLDTAGRALHLELEPLRPGYQELPLALDRAGPKLLGAEVDGEPRLLLYLRRRGATACLLGRDGQVREVALRELYATLRAGVDPAAEARVEALLDRARLTPERRARARDTMLDEALAAHVVEAGWSLALPPSAPFLSQLREAGLVRRGVALVVCQVAAQALALLAWWLIGKGALEGRLEPGWLVAWALLLATLVPLRSLSSWWQGSAALELSVLLKRRLLAGALELEPEETRHQGAGQLLGRVIESEALEALVTTGGLASVLGLVEVLVAGGVLAGGPGGAPAAGLFAAWIGVLALASWRYSRRLRDWTTTRLAMTHDLVERMVGHRTRLAQEPRETWHVEEDAQLSGYLRRSAALDRVAIALSAAPGAWLVLGLLSLAPAFIAGQTPGATLALGVGGVLLAHGALARLAGGVGALLAAEVAWAQAGELFRAGARTERPGRAALLAASAEDSASTPYDPSATHGADAPTRATRGALVEARDLCFRYPGRREPVLRGVGVRIDHGDRLLLEGPSGGGKSTLGALLTGLRAPDTGLLLLGGLDRHTLGRHGWRRRVVGAPQFHENHVLSATFAFNLLMGRGWPARPDDLQLASEVCVELGLGALLERMPAGLSQMVGETGWQLSHGERSRLFIARALLQDADLIVLDESFAALDPITLERALRCVLARARTLVVVAHP